jgi:hypothetical protein
MPDDRPAHDAAPAAAAQLRAGDGNGNGTQDAPATAPADPAKAASRELAALLATPEGARVARALQRAGMLTPPPPGLELPTPASATPPAEPSAQPPAAPADPPTAGAPAAAAAAPQPGGRPDGWPRPISIWQPRGSGPDLAFVRPRPLPLGDHFAARREIRPKRAPMPLRICLFGESAAAGYLYAPRLTPATVLEAQLRAVAGQDAVEVIDLARTNETLPSLLATLESAVQIQPDVLVLFAGNNWNLLETPDLSPYAPSVAARQDYAAAWREAGPAGPVALAADRLRALARSTFERIAQIARALGVPVVVVVPEVSLTGWESRQPISWWSPAPPTAQGGIAAWYRRLARARRQLERGAWSAAARTATAMLDQDGGVTPTSWRLLANARSGAGDHPGAAAAARAEIDAAAYPTLAFLAAPQATTLTHHLLRQAGQRHGFACVDLPHVFATHTGSPLPGRRLFLDYCHLTSEGFHVAMAALASEILRVSGLAEADLPWQTLVASLPPPAVPAAVEAVARLGAAVHGAHRLLAVGPKAPFLEAWCDQALAAAPGIESAMLDLVAARAAPLPAVLTPAQRRNLASDFTLGLQHGWRWDHVDADLVAAILATLTRHARPAADAALSDLIAHRALRPTPTELLDPPYYLWEPLERFYPDVMPLDDVQRPATHRSPWPTTSLCLVSEGDRDAALAITARLSPHRSLTPPHPRRGTAHLTLNGAPAGTLPLTTAWTQSHLPLPAHLLRRGLNQLTLHWPIPRQAPTAPADALARLDQGIAADLHPAYGELYSLQAHTT